MISNGQPFTWITSIKLACLSVVAGIIALIVAYGLWFFEIHPEFRNYNHPDVQTAVIPGSAFRPVVARGSVIERGAIVVTGFSGGRAIVSTPARFLAEDFPFIKVHMEGLTRFTQASILWRQSNNPNRLYSLPLNRSGNGVTQVAMVSAHTQYRGEIEELAIGFFDGPANGVSGNKGAEIRVQGLELRPFNWRRVVDQVGADWFHPAVWPGYANNVVMGIPVNGMVLPNLALNLLAALSLLIALVLTWAFGAKSSRPAAFPVAALVIIATVWLLGDALRWPMRIEQVLDAQDRYEGRSLLERGKNNSHRCARNHDCYEHLAPYF